MTEPRNPATKPGGRKHGQKNKFSAATISRDLREMAISSLHFVGGVKYLAHVAHEEPAAYLQFLTRCLVKEDGGSQGLTIQVVSLPPTGTPTPGVINSPVVEDIAPQVPLRLVDAKS